MGNVIGASETEALRVDLRSEQIRIGRALRILRRATEEEWNRDRTVQEVRAALSEERNDGK